MFKCGVTSREPQTKPSAGNTDFFFYLEILCHDLCLYFVSKESGQMGKGLSTLSCGGFELDVDLFTPKVMATNFLPFKIGISKNAICYLCKIDYHILECLGFKGEKDDSLSCFL